MCYIINIEVYDDNIKRQISTYIICIINMEERSMRKFFEKLNNNTIVRNGGGVI